MRVKLPNISEDFLNCRKRITVFNWKMSNWVDFQTPKLSLGIIDDHKILKI